MHVVRVIFKLIFYFGTFLFKCFLVLGVFGALIFAITCTYPPCVHVVLKGDNNYYLVDTLRACMGKTHSRLTIVNTDSLYKPTRQDLCIRCNRPCWRHWQYRTDEAAEEYDDFLNSLMSAP